MLLHRDEELFREVISSTAADLTLPVPIAEKVYFEDYESITAYFQNHPLGYDTAITALEQIAESNMFEE